MKNKKRETKKRAESIIKRDRAITRSSRKIARSMMLTGMFGVVAVTTSCTSNFGGMGADGHFAMYGDAEGIRAFSDTINGLVTTGKASPDTEDAYWKTTNTRNVLKFKVIRPSQKGGK